MVDGSFKDLYGAQAPNTLRRGAGVASAAGHMINPEMLWSPVRWAKQVGFLSGTLFEMVAGKQPARLKNCDRTQP